MSSAAGGEVVVLALADIAPGARLWGYARFVLARFAMRRVPGLRFFKVLGSGHEGGFGLKPSASRQGLLAVFDDAAQAQAFLQSPVLGAYRERSTEFLTAVLQAYSSRGRWAGREFGTPRDGAPASGPIAALTRASIRPRRAARFWRHAPPSEVALQGVPGCRLAVGLGEAPLLRQCTFSLWDDEAAMNAYARSGAHLQAISSSVDGGFFSESMFTRFVPVAVQGAWKGRVYGQGAERMAPLSRAATLPADPHAAPTRAGLSR